jgi:hypothetical protein
MDVVMPSEAVLRPGDAVGFEHLDVGAEVGGQAPQSFPCQGLVVDRQNPGLSVEGVGHWQASFSIGSRPQTGRSVIAE